MGSSEVGAGVDWDRSGVFGVCVQEWSILTTDAEGGSVYECSTLIDDKTVGWVSGEGVWEDGAEVS